MTRRSATRWLVLGAIVVLVIVWAATAGEEHTALARSFLRNLLRAF